MGLNVPGDTLGEPVLTRDFTEALGTPSTLTIYRGEIYAITMGDGVPQEVPREYLNDFEGFLPQRTASA